MAGQIGLGKSNNDLIFQTNTSQVGIVQVSQELLARSVVSTSRKSFAKRPSSKNIRLAGYQWILTTF